MELLKHSINLSDFFELFAEIENRILFLDFDGTLSPFTLDRDNAKLYPGVAPRLEILSQSQKTRLIIISGREVESLARLLGLSNVPELIGCHGAEILTRGAHKPDIEVSTIASSNLEKIKKLVSGSALKDFSEIKPSGIAFHWRGEQKSIKEMINAKVLEFWTILPPTSDLEVHPFDGGIEIRCTGINKGLAVTRILRESKPNSIVAFLGDDQTDEEAFAAIGDRGLKVLVRNNLRPTRANVKLTPPYELVDFLDNWIDADMY